MAIFDEEFGEIKVRKNKLARTVKISVGVDGALRASIPYYSPEFAVKRLIRQNREQLREMVREHSHRNAYQNGDMVGKSHTLIFREDKNVAMSGSAFSSGKSVAQSKTKRANQKRTDSAKPKISVEGNQIIVAGENLASPLAQAEIRQTVAKILRKQAKAYLPRRVEFLAEKHGFQFKKLRFSHTGTRWGSCSTSGTISLNITLMNLPFHLIDYVVIHELCHTRQMNHSEKFWAEVEKYDPEYRQHVREMKQFSPTI
jgi:predicted metal-dependent hydrolase